MVNKNPLSKLKNFFGNFARKKNPRQIDSVKVSLPGLNIQVDRNLHLETPHELTVVVPRAQITKKCLNEDCSKYEYKLTYSSITVVHAPRHPLAGPSPMTPNTPNNP
ncbi:MAG: hypothetical protein ACOX2A_07225 [Tepidanaerobacteraceae bacterium]|jgi:hypothetical protein|nr:hypothetical protein [Thermoanaerobacterales bacterium]